MFKNTDFYTKKFKTVIFETRNPANTITLSGDTEEEYCYEANVTTAVAAGVAMVGAAITAFSLYSIFSD